MKPQLNKTNARSFKTTLERRAVQRVVTFVMNEWCRRSIEEPEAFEAAMLINEQFLRETNEGKLPSYGQKCARYMLVLLGELTAPKRPVPKPSLSTSHRQRARKPVKQPNKKRRPTRKA